MDKAINLTKSYIEVISPNARAVVNARGLMGCFLNMRVDESRSRLFAECSGSSANSYSVKVLLHDPLRYSCTCPSYQSPCKHVLGLLMLYESKPEVFSVCSEKSEFLSSSPDLQYDKSALSLASIKKKNLLRLRGLHAAKALCDELMECGFGRISVLPALLDKSSILLTYKLPEVYSRWRAIIYTLLGEEPYKSRKALDMLSRYHSALMRSIDYYITRTEDDTSPVDYKTENWLGAAWTISHLEAIGNITEDARLIQLSFSVKDNSPAKRVEETGIWMNLNTGEIVRSMNLRPFSALSKTRESDSFSDVLLIQKLFHYPLGLRARWNSFTCVKPSEADFQDLTAYAVPGGAELQKSIKNQMLDSFEDSPPIALVGFKNIMAGERGLVLTDNTGGQIELSDGSACDIISFLPLRCFNSALLEFQVENGRITASPLCLAGKHGLFRLDN